MSDMHGNYCIDWRDLEIKSLKKQVEILREGLELIPIHSKCISAIAQASFALDKIKQLENKNGVSDE